MFLESPFAQASPAPVEGTGLSPILRHPAMMIHPPMLYSGYTLFTVPFAFAIGALVTRRLGTDWIRTTRPFALAAWLCLGTGLVLGARWSYSELGWGGYWAWDGVENAALMPWLTGTAFLHSAMVWERRGMLKVWNVSLVLLTGILALLGTFLVRSGILESIHAFGASTLGVPFLVLIVTLVAVSIVLVVTRAKELRSEHRLDSLLSRETVFLLNNLVLVMLCFVIFWGTFFPLISEALTGTQASVGPPWFGRYITPLALVLVLLSGLGPMLAWRRATAANLWRVLLIPVGVSAAALVALLAFGGVARRPLALIMFCLAAFVLAVVGQELWRGVRARRAMADESVPRGAGLARAPQPPPLRRVPGPRRHRRGVRGNRGLHRLPGRSRPSPLPRREGKRGGLRDRVPAADRKAGPRAERIAREDRSRRRATGAPKASPSRSCCARSAASFPRPIPHSERSRVTSRARRPARSACAAACGATCGRSSPRTHRPA